MATQNRPNVVIIGGGFAGLAAAKELKHTPVHVTLIDRTNHHLFQPLLYQVATAALAPSDVAVPIRHVLRKQNNVEVLLGEVNRIDVETRQVFLTEKAQPIPYDYLVVATGWRHAYYGHDEWEALAPGLKSINDALEIRERFLMAFEEAEKEQDPEVRAALMTFVIVGGGPTGVELAGVIPEITRHSLRPDFRNIDPAQAKVILLEGGKRILATFDEKLSQRAQRDLESLGVDVRVNARVTNIEPAAVILADGTKIATHNVIWAAGNAGSPLGKMLGAPLNKFGQVIVEPDLSVPGHPEIFVAGDLAASKLKDGSGPVPAVAQGAIQGGACAGRNIRHRIQGEKTESFAYFDKGNMAVIGRNKAIVDTKIARFGGFFAWAAWLFIHILYLVDFRNRVSVLLQWAYAYLTMQRGVRLITDRDVTRYQYHRPGVPVPAEGQEAERQLGELRSKSPGVPALDGQGTVEERQKVQQALSGVRG